jgi:lysophospholipase
MVVQALMIHFLALLVGLAYCITPDVDLSPLDPAIQHFVKTHESQRIFYDNILYNHYYSSKTDKDTAVVFLPGMGEPAIKYYDITTDLEIDATYYLWDHIGQGISFHFVPLERQKVYVDTFDTYTKTLTHFLESIRSKHKTIIVIAHSMGGHIALKVSHEKPLLIDKLVLSAPLIEINKTWVPIHFIAWLANIFPGEYYPPFYFLFKKNSERGNYTTTSKEKVAIYKQTKLVYPEIVRSGATLSWIRASLESIDQLKKMSWNDYKTPLLLIQAEEDFLVSNPAQNEICKRIPTCSMKHVLKSRHELLFENKEPRDAAVTYIKDFLIEKKK